MHCRTMKGEKNMRVCFNKEHTKEGAYERTGKTGMGYRYQRDGDG